MGTLRGTYLPTAWLRLCVSLQDFGFAFHWWSAVPLGTQPFTSASFLCLLFT